MESIAIDLVNILKYSSSAPKKTSYWNALRTTLKRNKVRTVIQTIHAAPHNSFIIPRSFGDKELGTQMILYFLEEGFIEGNLLLEFDHALPKELRTLAQNLQPGGSICTGKAKITHLMDSTWTQTQNLEKTVEKVIEIAKEKTQVNYILTLDIKHLTGNKANCSKYEKKTTEKLPDNVIWRVKENKSPSDKQIAIRTVEEKNIEALQDTSISFNKLYFGAFSSRKVSFLTYILTYKKLNFPAFDLCTDTVDDLFVRCMLLTEDSTPKYPKFKSLKLYSGFKEKKKNIIVEFEPAKFEVKMYNTTGQIQNITKGTTQEVLQDFALLYVVKNKRRKSVVTEIASAVLTSNKPNPCRFGKLIWNNGSMKYYDGGILEESEKRDSKDIKITTKTENDTDIVVIK